MTATFPPGATSATSPTSDMTTPLPPQDPADRADGGTSELPPGPPPAPPGGPGGPGHGGPGGPVGPNSGGPDFGGPTFGPGGGPTGPAPVRLLRRSRTNRMGVGLCGGLGEYFGVDPVIFRVLIGVLSIFGGAGVLLYLLGWLVVPEEGNPESGLDRVVADLRRRRVPFALAVIALIVLAWIFVFSWWAPAGLVPAVIVAAVALFLLAHRDHPRVRAAAGMPVGPASPPGQPYYGPVPPAQTAWMPPPSATAAGTGPMAFDRAPEAMGGTEPAAGTAPIAGTGPLAGTGPMAGTPPMAFDGGEGRTAGTAPTGPMAGPEPTSAWPPPQATAPAPVSTQLREWREESRQRRRERRRRHRPVRIATWLTLLVAVATLAVLDATTGVALSVYFWVIGLIVLTGLIVGLALRRPGWGTAWLLVPCLIGVLALGTSGTSLHDGVGTRNWQPASTAAVESAYRLSSGRIDLDLSRVQTAGERSGTLVVLGAGTVHLVVPSGVPMRVHATLRAGEIVYADRQLNAGTGLNQTIVITPAELGQPVFDVDVRMVAGRLIIDRT